MWAPHRITLHNFRWSYAAARASVYLVVITMVALDDPGYPGMRLAPAASAKPYERLNRDIVRRIWRYKDLDYGLGWYREHNPHSRLVLRVERDTPIRFVREALRQAGEAGFRRVTLQTRAPVQTLFRRRLDTWPQFYADDSVLHVPPPDPAGDFSLNYMWH